MKRLLVISNNCFSNTNSNGRTLGNLLYAYDKKKLAQFYISGKEDTSFCTNYFHVSDRDVVQSIFHFVKKKEKKPTGREEIKGKRTVPAMMIRNFIWNLGLWKSKKFKRWLDDYKPDCILIQMGDCAFMIRLALWIADRFSSKIYIYNSEAYYFKSKNYFRDGHDFLYKRFITNYKKWFRKIIHKADTSVYLCESLKEEYDKEFHENGVVIYNSSSLRPSAFQNDGFPIISYLGNLSLGRDVSLCEIAEVLKTIDPKIKLNVYGAASEKTLSMFKEYSSIEYHGFVSYEKTQQVMMSSHILLHVESFEDFYVEDTKYGFSGKIADSLCSGRVFIVYGPPDLACIKYLRKNGIKSVASDKEELKELLSTLLFDKERCKIIAEKQIALAKKNHDLLSNAQKMQEIINK